MNVNIRRIKAFIMVATTHNVTEAARRMNMTAPAITKGVRELEQALGAALFQRTSQGMQLTAEGKAFYLHSKRALRELEDGQRAVSDLRGGVGGKVAVAAQSDVLNFMLPTAVAQVLKRVPDLELEFAGGDFDNLVHSTRVGDLDLFVGLVPEAGHVDGLTVEVLYEDELSIVVRADHPLLQKKRLTLKELTNQSWIRPTESLTMEHLLKDSFDSDSIPYPKRWIMVRPLGAMRTILYNTDFLAAVSRMRVHEELGAGLLKILPVELPNTRHQVAIFSRGDEYLSRWARQVVIALRRIKRGANP
ncbi:MAG: LysR family transcriptional regulator [Rhizomicrobium sp.]